MEILVMDADGGNQAKTSPINHKNDLKSLMVTGR